MKIPAFLIGLASFLLMPAVAYAEVNVDITGNESSSNVSVESESNGTSTICQNGKCTTTGGGSTSTVCVNGKCTTSGNNVNYESEDGSTRIRINNNTTNDPMPTSKPEVTKGPTPTKQPTPTIDPQIQKEIETAQKEAEAVQERIKQRVKDQESAIEAFIKAELESLQKLLNTIFG
jgi:hypothetical protein